VNQFYAELKESSVLNTKKKADEQQKQKAKDMYQKVDVRPAKMPPPPSFFSPGHYSLNTDCMVNAITVLDRA